MKKIVSLALALVMIISLLVGCKGGMPSGEMPSGSDAAKLLLANERLNAQLLKTEGDIFEDGVEVMYNLAKIANDNLHIPYVSSSAPLAINLSSAVKTSTVLKGNYSGKVEIDGGTFTWSGFEENNNSYDYFKNLTDNIVSTAF